MNKIIPLEREEQITFVEWLELKGLKFSAIPNSTWTPSWKQKASNRVTGLRPGLPDILIIVPPEKSIYDSTIMLFIEMKRVNASPSDTRPEQKEWIKLINEVNDIEAAVCKGATEAIAYVEQFLCS